MTLTIIHPAHETFAREYVARGARRAHAIAAAEAAGFPVDHRNQAYNLLNRQEVQAEIKRAIEERFGELEITAKKTFEEMGRIAFSDPAELLDENGNLLPVDQMSPAQRAAIASMEFETNFGRGPTATPVTTIKVKLWNKPDMLKVLAQHFKIIDNDKDGLNALAGELASQLRAGRERAQAARRATPLAEVVEEARIIEPVETQPVTQETSDEDQIW